MAPDRDRWSQNGSLRLAEAVGAIAYAGDLAFGFQFEDGVRSAYLAVRIAERLELSPGERQAVYYTGLLKDAGCTCWSSQLAAFWMADEIVARRELLVFGDPTNTANFIAWLIRYVGPELPLASRLRRLGEVFLHQREFMQEGFETACEVASRIAARLAMPPLVQEAVGYLFERWDGRGAPRGAAAVQIPIAARIVFASFFLAPFHSVGGRQAAIDLARKQRGVAFDPAVADAFLDLAEHSSFWAEVEAPTIWQQVLDREPAAPLEVDDARLEDVSLAFADFIDLKSPYTAAHSRRAADVAARLARRLGCREAEVRQIRCATLMHDLGLVGVPSFTLDKPDVRLSEGEREQLRLHPYHGERILARVDALDSLAIQVGAHHERMDGRGYYRGLQGSQIPLGARIVAVADRFDELTHDSPGHAALDAAAAVATISAESGTSLFPEVVRALCDEVGDVPRAASRRTDWPAGLTDREVEALRLASRGLSRRQMAQALVVSESTVRHHLEHVYNKVGVSTRVAATVFAMEHDLLP